MLANRRRDTGPELALRRELHSRGLRFRVDFSPVLGLRCRPDVVFTRRRVAVFMDGCFWHSCPEHGNLPKANREWWQEKLCVNVSRDRRNDQALLDAGWHVIRVWEHEPVEDAASRICEALKLSGTCSEFVDCSAIARIPRPDSSSPRTQHQASS
jgi:DNA mismatch endonuclease (patch repair protein)